MKHIAVYLGVLALLASLASAWSDYSNQYLCDEVLKTVWGEKIQKDCIGSYDLQSQRLLCQRMPENKREMCMNITRVVHPATLPNLLGEGELSYSGICPIQKYPEKTYICSTKDQITANAEYWINNSIYSDSRCHRIQAFCVASNYLAQYKNPFASVLHEDVNCKDLIYRKVEESLKAGRTTWGFDQGCAFTYYQNIQSKPQTTYIYVMNVNSRHKNEIVQNLTLTAQSYIGAPYTQPKDAETTTTTMPAPDCFVDADCGLTNVGCCGCEAGGKRISISSRERENWIADLAKNCIGTACPSVMSQHISCYSTPKCEAGACTLQTDTGALCADESIKANCAGEAPTTQPGTSQQYGVSCGYINNLCKWGAPQTTIKATTTTSTIDIPTTAARPPTTRRTTTTQEETAPAEEGMSPLVYVMLLVFLAVGAAAYFLTTQSAPKESDHKGEEHHRKEDRKGGLRELRDKKHHPGKFPERKSHTSLSDPWEKKKS